MAKFSIRHKICSSKKSSINLKWKTCILLPQILFVLFTMTCIKTHAMEKGVIAVLPFRIESSGPNEHLGKGLQSMLTGRMADRGYQVVSPDSINSHPLNTISYFETKDLVELGRALNTDWIIWGNLTETGDNINLDIRAADVINTSGSFSIVMVENNLDNMAAAMFRAAAGIDNRISGITLIEKINIEGNARIGDDAIYSLLLSREDDPYDPDIIDQDLRSIYRMGFFNNVETLTEDGKEGKIITFIVEETPQIVRIKFEGNRRRKEEKLLEEAGIKLYSVLNRSEIRQSVNRLLESYRKTGYYNIQITEVITESSKNEVTVTYVIDEGQKVYIRNIDFIGNEAFSDRRLKRVMRTRTKSFLSWLTSSGVLDQNKLEFDEHMLSAFYNSQGYIRSRIGAPEVTYHSETDSITVTIRIVEGNQYIVDDILFEGDLIIPHEELLNRVTMQTGRPFSSEVLQTDIQAIKSVYADEGYAYTEIDPVPVEKDQENHVDVLFRIEKNQKVRFERINIHGNEKTRDKVIRRELRIAEGEDFSGEKLNRSNANLRRLGFFEEQDGLVFNTRRGSSDDLMIVDISVKERQFGTISGGIGYGGYEKTFLHGQISQSNFRGLGQRLDLDASLSSSATRFNTSFTEPWLFDTRLSMTTSLTRIDYSYNIYDQISQGLSLGFGFPLEDGDYTRGTISYSIDESKVSNVHETISPIISDMYGSYINSSITMGIFRNSTDEPRNPRKGSYNSLYFKYSGGILGGDSYFNKYTATSKWYLPMKWRSVFVISGQGGYVHRRSGGRLPLYEKFWLGGDNTIRGYDYYIISPLDPVTLQEIGGSRMWLYSLEYRYPFGRDDGIMAYVFYDVGNSFEEMRDWKTGTGYSAGFGIKWWSPMGPLDIAYAFRLRDRPNQSRGGKLILGLSY